MPVFLHPDEEPPTSVRNIKPKGRQLQRTKLSRDALEKQRLKQRTEKHQRFGDEIDSWMKPDESAAMYASETQRFDSDGDISGTGGHDSRHSSQQRSIQRRRSADQRREEALRARDDEAQRQERILLEHKRRQAAEKGGRNSSSIPYNPITLEYEQSIGGQELRFKDEKAKYRAEVRKHTLTKRLNMTDYNPLTGASRTTYETTLPSRPKTPPYLQEARERVSRQDNDDGRGDRDRGRGGGASSSSLASLASSSSESRRRR